MLKIALRNGEDKMIINAYKAYTYETKEPKPMKIASIVNDICNKLIIEHGRVVESRNTLAIKKQIELILVNEYSILDKKLLDKIIHQIIDKIYGYGILEKYIKDGITSDIRVVKYNQIYIKQKGVWKQIKEHFENNQEFNDYIRFCALKNGQNINFESPVIIFSDRKNGLRIEAGIEPVNISNSSLVIRIHRKDAPSSLEKLFLQYGMVEKESYTLLKEIVKNRKNIIICGKGGSGKTTLLRALINELPKEIAITTNEETAELYLTGRNVIARECVLTRSDDKNIDLEKLSKHSLVMSNDAIIIGELKGKEANTFFDAISTGHLGLATLHADSSRNVIDRIVTLIKKDAKAVHYTEDFLRRFLSSSIQYIIFMSEYKVMDILQVKYMENTRKLEFVEKYVRR